MKLLETYSLNCSVEIRNNPPFLLEKFFPLGATLNKYIILQSTTGMPAKNYSFWSDVIDILYPILEKENIKIVSLGEKETSQFDNVINLGGTTSIHQAYYLGLKSLLLLGGDSWLAHALINTPKVILYGSTSVKNHSPYFYDKEKTIFLESHRNGNFPTFAREEMPKTVDFIKPEEIAKSVCSLLNLPFTFPYETVYISPFYTNKVIELVPNQSVNISQFGLNNIIVRMDILFNEICLLEQAKMGKVSIVTDIPINLKLLEQIKPQIQEVYYLIGQRNVPSFVESLFNLGIKTHMFSYEDKDYIRSQKLNYCDFGIIHQKEKLDISKIKEFEGIDKKSLFYKSQKFILSNGKIYPSVAAFRDNLNIKDFKHEILPVIDSEDFYKEGEYFYFLKKKV